MNRQLSTQVSSQVNDPLSDVFNSQRNGSSSGLHLSGTGDPLLENPQAVMDTHAKSFSWAARFLAPQSRSDAATLYAFARLADDLADEDHLGTLDQRLLRLQVLKDSAMQASLTHESAASSGQSFVPSHPSKVNLGILLAHLLKAKDISPAVLAYFMDSLQADAEPRQLQTEQELLTFAYGVAGTVGLMMRPILGAPKTADSCAMALGIGMQLSNIARDVMEDAQRGRCYIPAQWGISLKDLDHIDDSATSAQCFDAVKKMVCFADDFYGYAEAGIALIPKQNRRAIHIATALYRGIGQKIVRQGAQAYWKRRTSLTKFEKSKLIVQCYLGSVDHADVPSRDLMAHDLAHMQGVAGFPV